jgi:glycosyltransferase involved in cell wall biosynthesis
MIPLVSVIIPTFNRSRYIGEAVESVIAQDYPKVEVIVVDDGSTDDTEAKVRAFGDRVRYFRTEHGGVARARNIGTRHAGGEFITYLDSDDRHCPYTIELQARLLERLPEAAFVCAEMSGFDDAGSSTGTT